MPDLRSPGTAAFYASSAIALVFAFMAIWPQSMSPFDPTVNDLPLLHKPPGHVDEDGGFHLLGTDHLGRDVWSRLVWGARASLMVGASGLVLGGIVGISLGLVAGYRGGWTDRIAMRIVDAFLSFPYILIAIVWAALIGTDLKSLILIVAVRGWVEFCRVVRGQALSLRERDYVSAARAVGATDWRIVLRHILPNTVAPILVVAGYELGRLVLLEAHPLLPHHRHPPPHPRLGKHALRRPQLPDPGVVDRDLPGNGHLPDSHVSQLHGRQPPRPPRPHAPGKDPTVEAGPPGNPPASRRHRGRRRAKGLTRCRFLPTG